MTGMRERYRAHVREEVKAAALEQLAAGGPASLSVNAIAKAMGVSGPRCTATSPTATSC